MTVNELGHRLRKMYDDSDTNKATMVHLFGILYADEIRQSDIRPIEIIKAAQMHESYQTELRKGMYLAQYVQLKECHLSKFLY